MSGTAQQPKPSQAHTSLVGLSSAIPAKWCKVEFSMVQPNVVQQSQPSLE